MQCFLPTVEETQIELIFPDSQEPFIIDAMDIQSMVSKIFEDKIPEDSSFEEEFVRMFKQKYNRVISKTAANMLYQAKEVMLNKVKKNLFEREKQFDTSVAPEILPIEKSDSSSSQKKRSKRKKS